MDTADRLMELVASSFSAAGMTKRRSIAGWRPSVTTDTKMSSPGPLLDHLDPAAKGLLVGLEERCRALKADVPLELQCRAGLTAEGRSGQVHW
ncbi:hypothetical protein JNB88_18095 [Rhizobium cauense]|nr:hypothetical protein [Rhizobium cauense]MBW9115552.1 hypothetical protein [Rhizobium cauense]